LGSVIAGAVVHFRCQQKLHQRLQRLGNRIDPAALGKIMTAVHARVPMVTLEEQHTLKLSTGKTNQRAALERRDAFQSRSTARQFANVELAFSECRELSLPAH
jgi:hypothetical protein